MACLVCVSVSNIIMMDTNDVNLGNALFNSALNWSRTKNDFKAYFEKQCERNERDVEIKKENVCNSFNMIYCMNTEAPWSIFSQRQHQQHTDKKNWYFIYGHRIALQLNIQIIALKLAKKNKMSITWQNIMHIEMAPQSSTLFFRSIWRRKGSKNACAETL